jgi:hypothetical protein
LLEVDLATVGVVKVDLAVDHVVPGGCAGVCTRKLSATFLSFFRSYSTWTTYPRNQPYKSRHRSSGH